MKVARLAALAFAFSLTLIALTGARDRAAAQAAVDTPSGSGRLVQVTGDPETGPVAVFAPALRIASLIAGGRVPMSSKFSTWLSAPRPAASASYRSAGSSGERRGLHGPLSHQWARPVGR